MEQKEHSRYYTKLDTLMPIFREQFALGKSVRFSPQGISMLPMLRQDIDSVELSALPQRLKKYDLPLYQRKNGHYVLHRVIKLGDTYTCIGDNQFEEEPGIAQEQMIAVVTAFYRNQKRWSTGNIFYRAYCAFWHRTRSLRRFFRRGKGWLLRHIKRG